MYVHGAQGVSPRTRDLTKELRTTIDRYQGLNPKVSADEIRAALAAVTPGTRYTPAWQLAVAGTIVFVIGLFVAFVAYIEQTRHGRPVPWALLGALLGPAAAVVVVLWMRTNDD